MFFQTIAAWTLINSSLVFVPAAITHHGSDQSKAAAQMPTRITEDGTVTYHAGFGMQYREGILQLGGIYFRDTFGHHAGSLMAGPRLNFNKYFNVGLVAGVYVREFDEKTNTKLPISTNNGEVELAPMGGLTGAISIPVTRNIMLDLAATSNYYLNFFTPGLRIDF